MTITLDSLSFVVLILVPALLGLLVGWTTGKAEGRDNERASMQRPAARIQAGQALCGACGYHYASERASCPECGTPNR